MKPFSSRFVRNGLNRHAIASSPDAGRIILTRIEQCLLSLLLCCSSSASLPPLTTSLPQWARSKVVQPSFKIIVMTPEAPIRYREVFDPLLEIVRLHFARTTSSLIHPLRSSNLGSADEVKRRHFYLRVCRSNLCLFPATVMHLASCSRVLLKF